MIVAEAKKENRSKNKFEFKLKLPNWMEKLFSHSWFSYVFLLYIVAFIAFGYTLLNNKMVIPVSGDFVIQEIPFYFNGYDDWWTALRTGHFPLWDESGMLGVNNVGANAFYYLFNIFFLPALLFPRSLMPQVQAFLIITKIVIAGIGMRKLLEIFKVSENTIFIVGIAYAFCGWNLCYLWFNHFFEIAALMPFFLLSIEILLRKRKCLPLIFTIAIVGITNYFFLIAFCFTGVLYAGFRYFQRFKEMGVINNEEKRKGRIINVHLRIEIILKGIFSFAAGLLLAALILVPCFDAVLSNTRVTNATYLDDFMMSVRGVKNALFDFNLHELFTQLKVFFAKISSWEAIGANPTSNKKYLMYPAVSFFFPTITCYDSPLFVNNGFDNHQASLYLYTPLTLMLVPSILLSIKEKKYSHILGFIAVIIFLFTPFAYYCFSGFTENAYGRWQIFVVAIYSIYVAIQLDKVKSMKPWYFDLSIVFTLLIQFVLIKNALALSGDDASATLELPQARLNVCYAMMFITGLVYLYIRSRFKKEKFLHGIRYMVMIEIIIFVNVVLQVHGTTDYNNSLYGGTKNTSDEVQLVERIKKLDDSYYRVFSTTADRTGNNLAMMFGSRGVGTFHSVYDYNLDDFLNWSQLTYGYGGWSMGVHEKRIYLDEFLGIKYYILKHGDVNVPFGFEEIFSTDQHSVYINTNFIELGFSFDKIYTDADNYDYKRVYKNELSYLSGAVVTSDVALNIQSKYPNIELTTSSLDSSLAVNAIYNPKYKIQKNVNNVLVDIEGPLSSENAKNLTYGSLITVSFERGELAANATDENPCYIDLNARMGENLMIKFYGNNNKLLTYDNHMTHWYNKLGDIKSNRGFYVNSEVRKIVIEVCENMDLNRYLLTPYVQYQYYKDFKNNIDKLNEHALQDIKVVNSDTIKFKTNYENNRIVVLTIPFDKGWSLKDEFNNDVELMMVNGGFLGFVAEEGNHAYTLNYVTPKLPLGLNISFMATLLIECYYVASQLLDSEKEKRRYLLVGKILKDNSPKRKSQDNIFETSLNGFDKRFVIDLEVINKNEKK